MEKGKGERGNVWNKRRWNARNCLKIARALHKNEGGSLNYVNLLCSFVFNECRLLVLLVAFLRLLDRRSTRTGTRSDFFAKISSRFPGRPCGITWFILMIIQSLSQLKRSLLWKITTNCEQISSLMVLVIFSRLNNEKNIISTIFIFFNWRVIYGNFIWYIAYLLTTPDIMHWLGSRHRLLVVLFRRVRAKSSTLNRFCWHYTFENSEWLRLNNCLSRLSRSILNIFPITFLFGLPFRVYCGNMPMDVVTGCPSYRERKRTEWRNNRWNGVIYFALIFLLAGNSHWNCELPERA